MREAEFLSELTPIPIFSIQIYILCFSTFWADHENYYNIGGNHIIKEQTEKQLYLELSKKNTNIRILWKICIKTKYLQNQKFMSKIKLLTGTISSLRSFLRPFHDFMILWSSVHHTLSSVFWQKVFTWTPYAWYDDSLSGCAYVCI